MAYALCTVTFFSGTRSFHPDFFQLIIQNNLIASSVVACSVAAQKEVWQTVSTFSLSLLKLLGNLCSFVSYTFS